MEASTPPGDFAIALRRLRESRSLTQEELAERSGLTAKAIGALERGERRRPYPHTVRSLADGLALDDDERASLVAAVPSRDAGTRAPAPASSQPPTPTTTTPDAGHTASAPPSPTLGAPSTAPPTPTTPLIGREADLDALSALVGFLRAPTHLRRRVRPEWTRSTLVGILGWRDQGRRFTARSASQQGPVHVGVEDPVVVRRGPGIG